MSENRKYNFIRLLYLLSRGFQLSVLGRITFLFNVSDDRGPFDRTGLKSEVWHGVIQITPALHPWKPGLLWRGAGSCVVENKKMVDFFSPTKMVPIICIWFHLGAEKVLQKMEIICYARPELLNPIHDGDQGLQFFPVNQEFPVNADHKR